MKLREFRTSLGATVFVNPAAVSCVTQSTYDPLLTVIYTTEGGEQPELTVKCPIRETVRRLEMSDEQYAVYELCVGEPPE